MLIDDHKYIAFRLLQIGIEEGRLVCPKCATLGWHEYYDEEGCMHYTECDKCRNPLRNRPPPSIDPYID